MLQEGGEQGQNGNETSLPPRTGQLRHRAADALGAITNWEGRRPALRRASAGLGTGSNGFMYFFLFFYFLGDF